MKKPPSINFSTLPLADPRPKSEDWEATRASDPLRPIYTAHHSKTTRAISIRLQPWMIDLAKEIARRYQIPYQKLIRLWVSDGLRKAVSSAKT